jgi:hypothetical protein
MPSEKWKQINWYIVYIDKCLYEIQKQKFRYGIPAHFEHCSSPNIVWIITLKRAGRAACMEEMRNAYNISIGTP